MSLFVTAVLAAALFQQPPAPGAALAPGLELIYASGADTQPDWAIDSVVRGVTDEGRTDCTCIVLRAGGPNAETRLLCRAGDTLFVWSARTNRWAPQRPVTAGVTISVPRAAGGSTRFEATESTCDAVGAARLRTIATTILTFEVADSSGWRVEREFGLVALRYPAGARPPVEC